MPSTFDNIISGMLKSEADTFSLVSMVCDIGDKFDRASFAALISTMIESFSSEHGENPVAIARLIYDGIVHMNNQEEDENEQSKYCKKFP